MSDLLSAHYASECLDQPAINWLKAQGVPPLAMIEPLPMMSARVRFDPDGTFEFEPEGVRVFTFVAEDAGFPVDIIAWNPKAGHLASWGGQAFALGQEQIFEAATYALEGALRVHRSPLSWLRAGRIGIVIVKPSVGYAWLGQAARIEAEDVAHSQEIWSLIQPPPPRPQIAIRKQEAA